MYKTIILYPISLFYYYDIAERKKRISLVFFVVKENYCKFAKQKNRDILNINTFKQLWKFIILVQNFLPWKE